GSREVGAERRGRRGALVRPRVLVARGLEGQGERAVSQAFSGWFFGERLERWLSTPQPVLRVEILRIGAPLAILGFMSSRLAHADEWLGDGGFRVPDLGVADYRQPLYVPPLPSWAAWLVAAVLVASGLAVAAGFRARRAAVVFAAAGV